MRQLTHHHQPAKTQEQNDADAQEDATPAPTRRPPHMTLAIITICRILMHLPFVHLTLDFSCSQPAPSHNAAFRIAYHNPTPLESIPLEPTMPAAETISANCRTEHPDFS